MPAQAIRRQLVPASFHQELVQAMTAAGFARMYQFTATTDRDVYHVPAQYAQETTHFFHLPDHGFLVQLSLSEHIDQEGRYDCWWSGAVHLQLDIKEMIAYEVYYLCSNHKPRFFMDDCVPLGHVMGNIDALLVPFRDRGTASFNDDDDSYSWKLAHSGPLTVAQLVTFVDGLSTHFGPFLQPKLAYNFDAFSFTNDYAWPEIRERFWRSFPTRLLKQLVPGRIRGRESVHSSMHQ